MDYIITPRRIGLRKETRFADVVDVDACFLLPEALQGVYARAKECIRKSDLPGYDHVRHIGYLRYITLRHSATTGEVMCIITTARPKDDAQATATRALLHALHSLGMTSTHWTINDGMGDKSVGTPHEHLGSPTIRDAIAGISCTIGPHTFFQGNPEAAGHLFTDAIAFAEGGVIDLFCGVGIIGLMAARSERVTRVTGVEQNLASIAMAKENIALNNDALPKTTPVAFIAADAGEWYAAGNDPCIRAADTVICDPARSGLGAKLCGSFLAHGPKTIIYISCNTRTHHDDVVRLLPKYTLTTLRAYDLFPQTAHVEMLSVLERRG
jgi:23S rRNA (uracil1939-C5)-methyltransferase